MFPGNENYKLSIKKIKLYLKALSQATHLWVLEAWDRLCTENPVKPLRFLIFFSVPVCSEHDETFQNIWSNSTPTIFPFPNYCAASKVSMLATECSYNIFLMLDYIKKKKKNCKCVFIKYTDPHPLNKCNGYYEQLFAHANFSFSY